MAIARKLERLLDGSGVRYGITLHREAFTARQVATAEHVAPYEVAKPVVFAIPQGYFMAVVPADSDVNLKALRRVVGAQDLRLATEAEMTALFPDAELGAMPPIGELYGLPMYVDRSLAAQKEIVFNGGTHREAVHMRYEDWERIAHPHMAGIARMRN
jgi:Ala-tRNA(Pro) deacylase